jgi:hypothetical protein
MTLDISMREIEKASKGCPMYSDRPLVPLAFMKKELLASFNLRNGSGTSIPVVPRNVDTFFSWSFLCVEASHCLGVSLEGLPKAVMRHLREIAFTFPDDADDVYSKSVRTWRTPSYWPPKTNEVWRKLIDDTRFNRFLRDFTFNYLLITQVQSKPATQLIKFSHQQFLSYNKITRSEALGLAAAEFPIDAPSVGWGRSYHLQVEPPSELAVTALQLFRAMDVDGATPLPADTYEARIGYGVAQIHTTDSLKAGDYLLSIQMRVAIPGYLRALWLSTLLAASVLGLGDVFLGRLQTAASTKTEAAVALLLVVPSLVLAYLVRPGEHEVASRLLRNLRYLAGLAGALTYFSGAALVLGWQGQTLRIIWSVGVFLVALIAVFVTAAIRRASVDIADASEYVGSTVTQYVVAIRDHSS